MHLSPDAVMHVLLGLRYNWMAVIELPDVADQRCVRTAGPGSRASEGGYGALHQGLPDPAQVS